MSRRLPPLNALRAYEAAARHLSLAKAAAELNVTPAAISHQLKTLEEHLGTSLFRRHSRGIRLTEAGRACLPAMTTGFECLAEAVTLAARHGRRAPLTVTVAPSIASKWLVPGLDGFAAEHPDIDLRIAVATRVIDLKAEGVDVAIRFGRGVYPGLRVERLFGEAFTPMCSPALRDAHDLKERPQNLRGCTLLEDESADVGPTSPTWATWLAAARVADLGPVRRLAFSNADHAQEAALRGVGVLLGRRTLAALDVAAGRLVCPFDLVIGQDLGYFLVTQPGSEADRRVAAFCAWAMAEAERFAKP